MRNFTCGFINLSSIRKKIENNFRAKIRFPTSSTRDSQFTLCTMSKKVYSTDCLQIWTPCSGDVLFLRFTEKNYTLKIYLVITEWSICFVGSIDLYLKNLYQSWNVIMSTCRISYWSVTENLDQKIGKKAIQFAKEKSLLNFSDRWSFCDTVQLDIWNELRLFFNNSFFYLPGKSANLKNSKFRQVFAIISSYLCVLFAYLI